jgi:RNA polymerase sigma-70 factor (ECF subfamily)
MSADERDLVERSRQGDRAAFGEIYQRHVDRVFAYVHFRVRERALAEDLTQDIFMQAIRGLDGYEWQGSIAPWLLRIARNAVIDHWRRMGRRPERTLSAVEAGEGDEDERNRIMRLAVSEEEQGLERADRALERARIARAAKHLTELQQRVLALRFAADLSIRETAEAMGRSEGAIKNLQHHAVRALRQQLEAEESDRSKPSEAREK